MADSCLWAAQLIDALAAAGVRRVAASPGARSTPLTLAALRHPEIETWIRLDERSAGFFALGLALADRRPVALVATSGSAPAHWYPAVIEAFHAKVPLILLSADRPEELQGCGANQTIDQRHLFGAQVREFWQLPHAEEGEAAQRRLRSLADEAVERSLWPVAGPVHLNVPLREPLVPSAPLELPGASPDCSGTFGAAFIGSPSCARQGSIPEASPGRAQLGDPREDRACMGQADNFLGLPSGEGFIVCGPGAYPSDLPIRLTALAERLGCPIFADPLSGLRVGAWDRGRLLVHYDGWLRAPEVRACIRPAWVLRFGAAPVSKFLLRLLEECEGAEQILVAPDGDRLDPTHRVTRVVRETPVRVCDGLLNGMVKLAFDTPLARRLLEMERLTARLAAASDAPEAVVVRALMERLPAEALLFSGNSMPIRDLDGFGGSRAAPLRMVANRGVSGIDGNISTILGLARGHPGPVVGMIGDLAFWHDHGALMDNAGARAVILVLNNQGGGIFGYLPQAGLPEFEQGWLTPVGLEIADAARLYRIPHRAVAPEQVEQALIEALPLPGVKLIEVRIDREASIAAHRRYWEAVRERIKGEG